MSNSLIVAVILAVMAGNAMSQEFTPRAATPRGTTGTTSAGTRKEVGQALRSDSAIEQNFRKRISKSKLNAEHFSISVRQGMATLEGRTNVLQHKGVATRLARNAGATSVRNNIQVSPEAKMKAAGNLQKPTAAGVERAVVAHPRATP